MKGIPAFASTILSVAALTLATATPAPAASNTNAIIGGIIAGAAAGAVVSGAIKLPKPAYVPPPPPSAPPAPYWGDSFSPKARVFCYPAQRACYNANGAYNANWTWKVYAR